MKALALDYERRALKIREVPPADVSPLDAGKVLLRIVEVGVCGTDVKLAEFAYGSPPAGQNYLILGHEAVGEVVAAGTGVENVVPGDWVAPRVRRGCVPGCVSCAEWRDDLCLTGKYTERGILGLDGYFTEMVLDDARELFRIPPELREIAILLEPLSVVEKAIRRSLEIHPGNPETALVIGAGAVGILAALALQLRGLEVRVTSAESADSPRARWLDQAGIRYSTPPSAIPSDLVIEAAGPPQAAFLAAGSLKPLGTACLLGGNPGEGTMPFRDMVLHNQTLFGSVNAAPEDFATGMRDLAAMDGALLRRLIHREGFQSAAESVRKLPEQIVKTVHRIAD